MSGLLSFEVRTACELVLDKGHTISAAARHVGVAVSSVRRALRRLGQEPGKPGRPAPPVPDGDLFKPSKIRASRAKSKVT